MNTLHASTSLPDACIRSSLFQYRNDFYRRQSCFDTFAKEVMCQLETVCLTYCVMELCLNMLYKWGDDLPGGGLRDFCAHPSRLQGTPLALLALLHLHPLLTTNPIICRSEAKKVPVEPEPPLIPTLDHSQHAAPPLQNSTTMVSLSLG